jgi:predicted CopG family antitoxin
MSKLINISNETYEKLRIMKGEDKSFTFVIESLIEKKENNTRAVLASAGIGGIDEKKIVELKKGWKKWTEKYA